MALSSPVDLMRRQLPFEAHGHLLAASTSALAVASFAFVASTGGGRLADSPLLFFLLPVVLFGIVFGVRGGVIAAALALALTLAGTNLDGLALMSRAVTFLLAGAVVGVFSDGRRNLIGDLSGALGESRDLVARLNLVAESVADGLVTIAEDGKILRFNTASERIFGYDRDEVVGENVLILMRGQDRASHEAQRDRYVRTGEARIIGKGAREVVGMTKDGTAFPMELTIGEATHNGERIFIGIIRDITERKSREVEQLHVEEMLEQLIVHRTSDLRERSIQLDNSRIETLRMLAFAAEYRDDQTFEHADRVGEAAAQMGEILGMDEATTSAMKEAAPLHDVGKLAITDAILLHPGSLTELERDQMRTHALVGHRILSQSQTDVFKLAAEIALSHHEWWDGSGYPGGLEGDEIPLSGRITAIADVFDALTHERPYKQAWTVKQAADEIRSLSGRQFDPEVVDAFMQLDLPAIAAG